MNQLLSKISAKAANISRFLNTHHTATIMAVIFILVAVLYWSLSGLFQPNPPDHSGENKILQRQNEALQQARKVDSTIIVQQTTIINKQDSAYQGLSARLDDLYKQQTQLKQLYGKNNSTIDHLDDSGIVRAFSKLK